MSQLPATEIAAQLEANRTRLAVVKGKIEQLQDEQDALSRAGDELENVLSARAEEKNVDLWQITNRICVVKVYQEYTEDTFEVRVIDHVGD